MTDPHNPDDYPPDVTTLDEMLAHDQRLQDARVARNLQEYRMQPLSLAERHSHAPLELRAVRAPEREADFVCSTDSIDSHGTRLRQDWNLTRYLANPVVLFAHESRELPIGQAKNVRVEAGRLLATVRFSDVHARAVECFKLVQEGTLRGISVGFRFGDYAEEKTAGGDSVIVLKDLELVELSITPTPSNPDCIAKIRSRATNTPTPTSPLIPAAPIAKKTEEQELAEFNDSLKTPEDREFDVLFERLAAEDRAAWAGRTKRVPSARDAAEEADLAEFNRSVANDTAAADAFFAGVR